MWCIQQNFIKSEDAVSYKGVCFSWEEKKWYVEYPSGPVNDLKLLI